MFRKRELYEGQWTKFKKLHKEKENTGEFKKKTVRNDGKLKIMSFRNLIYKPKRLIYFMNNWDQNRK